MKRQAHTISLHQGEQRQGMLDGVHILYNPRVVIDSYYGQLYPATTAPAAQDLRDIPGARSNV
jgi:hypothetical protein